MTKGMKVSIALVAIQLVLLFTLGILIDYVEYPTSAQVDFVMTALFSAHLVVSVAAIFTVIRSQKDWNAYGTALKVRFLTWFQGVLGRRASSPGTQV